MAKKKSVKVKFDGETPVGGVVMAKVPATITGTKVTFTHRHMARVGTGVSVKVDKGHKLCYSLVEGLAAKGMVAAEAPGGLSDGPLSVLLLNCGREIVEVKDGDPLVKVWVEPAVEWEWVAG